MSQSLLPAPSLEAPPVPPFVRPAGSRRWMLVACVLAFAHIPLLILHGRMLWAREHYQFFPLLAPAVFALAYRNLRELGLLTAGRRSLSYAWFGVSCVVLGLAIALFSPWLSAIATQITLLSCAFSMGGRRLVRVILPAWLLLWLAVPLPNQLDARLVTSLQQFASVGASRVLDILGVLHMRAGTTLDLGERRILVEEACSGVHSLFSLLACTLFWWAWKRRPLLHGVILSMMAVAWVLAGNIARIVAVASLDGYAGLNLSEGWGHEALGFCLFAGMLLLVWSTDHFLLWLTSLAKLPWRHVLVDLLRPVFGQSVLWLEPAEPALPAAVPTQPNVKSIRLPALASTTLGAWPVLVCFALLTIAEARLFQLQLAASPGSSLASLAAVSLPADTVHALEAWGESKLPEQYLAWRRAGFEAKERSADSPMGQFSRTWRYKQNDKSALAGVFYPFMGWKEVTICYAAQGWTVQDRQFHPADPANNREPYVYARMRHSLDESYAYLFFQMRDASDRPLAPMSDISLGKHVQGRFAAAWRLSSNSGAEVWSYRVPTYQVQLLVESPLPLSPAQEQEALVLCQQLFQKLRR